MNAATTTIYDHPLYYDILFAWDRDPEASFYHRLFARAGVGQDEPILEVACGTGQIARRLARLGRPVTGLDVSADMLAFLESAAVAQGVQASTLCADMTAFAAPHTYAAAFNPMSSFRLLLDDADASRHLRAVADALRPDGIYALDLYFAASDDEPEFTTDQSWTMSRGSVTVEARDDGIDVRDGDRRLHLSWGDEQHLRGYTSAAFAALVDSVDALAIEAWHPERVREGVSTFDAGDALPLPGPGRGVVVLRRG